MFSSFKFFSRLGELYPEVEMGGAVISISPSTISIFDTTPIGTTIATISVTGGFGTYTLSLTDPSGLFTIVGNSLQTQATLTAGVYPVVIHATNGLGDNPFLNVSINVAHATTYVPTYELFGF